MGIGATAAAPAAFWLALAAVVAANRASRLRVRLAATLASLITPLAAVAVLGFAAHAVLDRSLARGLTRTARALITALLAAAAITAAAGGALPQAAGRH